MKIAVVIPVDRYDILLKKCEPSRPEYELLRNGTITRDEADEVVVEVSCDLEQAERLLDFARQINRDAMPSIKESMRHR